MSDIKNKNSANKKKQTLITLSVVFLFFSYLFLQSNYYWPFYDGRFESERVHVQIGEHKFAFPHNYIWINSKQKPGKSDGSVHLKALLPGFDPMARANYGRFKKNESVINVTIFNIGNDRNLPSDLFQPDLKADFERLRGIYCPGNMEFLEEESKPYNLEVYTCGPGGDKLYTNKNKDFLFVCDDKKQWRNPQCQSIGNQSFLYGNLGFAFRFGGSFSSKSDEIYSFIKKLIQTAKTEGEKHD